VLLLFPGLPVMGCDRQTVDAGPSLSGYGAESQMRHVQSDTKSILVDVICQLFLKLTNRIPSPIMRREAGDEEVLSKPTDCFETSLQPTLAVSPSLTQVLFDSDKSTGHLLSYKQPELPQQQDHSQRPIAGRGEIKLQTHATTYTLEVAYHCRRCRSSRPGFRGRLGTAWS
jgi:hypothetical protein